MHDYERQCKRTKKRFKSLMGLYSNIFFYGSEVDSWLPEITLLPFVSLQWKLKPTWYRVIGPPSSGKSEHFKLIEKFELAYSIDQFTPKSFLSGFRGSGGEDPSALPQFDGKVLIISDESTLMEQRQEERNVVQSILRRAYDGTIAKTFGNIKGKQSYKAHFNFLLGSTPSIDRYFLYNQALGERYVNFRLQIPQREAITRRAYDNQFKNMSSKMDRLERYTHKFLRLLPEVDLGDVPISKEIRDYLIGCANFVALIRTHITRDNTGRHITTLPQPESAGRLVQQMTQAAISSAIIHGDKVVKLKHIDRAVYLGVGSVVSVIAFILYHIYQYSMEMKSHPDKAWFTVQYMVIRTALGRASIMRILEDFAVHRILSIRQGKTQGGRLIEYSLSKEIVDVINDIHLFENYVPPCNKILDIKRLDKIRVKANKPYAKPPARRRRSK